MEYVNLHYITEYRHYLFAFYLCTVEISSHASEDDADPLTLKTVYILS